MYKFQDLTPISGQISKFQEFQDNAQACCCCWYYSCNKWRWWWLANTGRMWYIKQKSHSTAVIQRQLRLCYTWNLSTLCANITNNRHAQTTAFLSHPGD